MSAAAAGGGGSRSTASGCVLTAVVAVIVTVAKAPDSLLVAIVIPILVADDGVHPPPVPDLRPAAGRARRGRPAGTPPGGAGDRAGPGHQPGGGPGRQRRHARSRPTCAPCSSPTSPGKPPWWPSAGSARFPTCRWSSSSRPIGPSIGPLLAYLDMLDASWPPDQKAPITFVVIPEYVARNWWERHPLQPVRQAAPGGAPRPAPHRRRQRPLPAR